MKKCDACALFQYVFLFSNVCRKCVAKCIVLIKIGGIYRLGVRGQSSDRTERWLCNSYSPFNEKPQPLLDTSHYIKTEISVTN